MLEVRLIGKFEIRYDGQPVNLTSRIAQSLFALLILNAGNSYRREKLAGIFWPDSSEKKARAYLRYELWRIRKALGSNTTNPYLLSDDISISFNPSVAYWLDVAQLTGLSEGAPAEELIKALSASQGELLPGFYEEWIVEEREHLKTIYDQKMNHLLEILEKEKRWNEIVNLAEHWISTGQSREAAYRSLMIAYAGLGDRGKVVETYQRCVQGLRELGLEPSEKTRALVDKRDTKLNIPIPLTSFIGREQECKEVAELLSRSRLVTLTGSGGIGKTRLAIQVIAGELQRFPDGVWFLDLAPVSDATLVPNTLANLLGIHESGHNKFSVTDLLINFFHSRTALVVFDNCEHVVAGCAQLVESLLTSCEGLSILATSREALRVSGEIPYRVPSLGVPQADTENTIELFTKIESVQLFRDRAAVASREFVISPENIHIIAEICRRLDGIPLALELAAARMNVLTLDQIRNRLDDRFSLLRGGSRTALPRYQTLRATIEWSYDLLPEQERLLFRRLAVFTGGWTLEAAEEVCSGEGIERADVLELLSQMVLKSLVMVETRMGETRYRRLATIRQFAQEKLTESGEAEQIDARHLGYFLHLTQKAEPELYGPEQMQWLQKLEFEHENLRASLEWAANMDIQAALNLSSRLLRFWETIDFREADYWLSKVLRKPESREYPEERAKALFAHGSILASLQRSEEARSSAEECLTINRKIGSPLGEIDGLLLLAWVSSDWNQRLELNHRALEMAQSLGDVPRQALASVQLGWAYQQLGQPAQHQHNFVYWWERAIALSRATCDWRLLAWTLGTLGFFLVVNGEIDSAQTYLDESNDLYKQYRMNRPPSHLLSAYGQIALRRGDFVEARAYFQKLIDIHELAGSRQSYFWTRARLGYVALREGSLAEASQIFAATVRSFQEAKLEIGVIYCLEGIASLYTVRNKMEQAARLIGWADALRQEINDFRPVLEQTDVARDTSAIIAKIGQMAFEEACTLGRNMKLEEAVAFALDELW